MATGRQAADSGARVRSGEAASHLRPHGALATTPARHVPGSRIAQAVHVASSANVDGAVIVDGQTGRRTRLDHFGSRLWQALASQPALPTLVASLRDEGTSAERLAEDVTRLLARWQAQRMIEWR